MGVRVRALLVVISTALALAGCSLFDNDPDPQPNPTGTVPTGEWAPVNVGVPLTLGWQRGGNASFYVDVDTMAVGGDGQYAEFATVDSSGDLYFEIVRHSGAADAPTRQPDARACAEALRNAPTTTVSVPVGRTDTPTFCLYTHRDDAAAQGVPPLLAIVETTGVDLEQGTGHEEFIEFVHVLVSTYLVPAD